MSIVRQAIALPGLSSIPPVEVLPTHEMLLVGNHAPWQGENPIPRNIQAPSFANSFPSSPIILNHRNQEIFPLWSQSQYKSEADRFSTSQNVGQRQPSTRHAHQLSP